MKAFVDSNEKLIDLQKKRKDIVKQEKGENGTTSASIATQNNIVFSGSGADLQRMFNSDGSMKNATPEE